MKRLNLIIGILLPAIFFSCDKHEIEQQPISSVTVANVIVGGPSLHLGSRTAPITSSSYAHFGLMAGDNNIYLWSEVDSTNPVYDQQIGLVEGHIYSLFLAGEVGNTVDPIWIEEHLPQYSGITGGVRFIHLAPSSPNVSIRLVGDSVNQFTDIAYKEITEFNTYSAAGNPINFEIIDNTTRDVMATFEAYPYLNRNITVAITGVNPGAPEISIVQVYHL